MAASTSRLSYSDCFDVLNKALSNDKGIRVEVPDYGAGNHFRVRLHTARSVDRKDNREAYSEDHKLYGRSIYDALVVQLREEKGKWWMYIRKFSTDNLNIEPLGEEHGINENTNGNLREAGGESDSQPREEASEAEIDVFDGEEEKEAKPVEEAPTQARRRV